MALKATFMKSIRTFLCDETAATAVEYAVMLTFILVAVIGAVTSFGVAQNNKWGEIKSTMTSHGL